VPSRKRGKRQGGPMTAAGLISFYDEYEEKIRLSPTTIVVLTAIYVAIVLIARLIG